MVYHLLKPTEQEILEGEDNQSEDAKLDEQIDQILKRINMSSRSKQDTNEETNYKHLELLLAEQAKIRNKNEKMVREQPMVNKQFIFDGEFGDSSLRLPALKTFQYAKIKDAENEQMPENPTADVSFY